MDSSIITLQASFQETHIHLFEEKGLLDEQLHFIRFRT